MIKKYKKKISEDDVTDCLIRAYMTQCLSGGDVESIVGSAETIGFIAGFLGLDPDAIPREAQRRKREKDE